MPSSAPRSEVTIAYLMAGVQFVNVLDFMMVNPLGPQFSEALGVRTSDIAIVVGSYTAAASVTGVLGSLYLERFDRRSALIVTLIGLAVGTALGGLSFDYPSLILARVVAGLFGGPATSLALAIVSDAIPAERRGWGIGIVMGGFAIASVLGVPTGLFLANYGGWRLPFFGVAGLIVVAAVATARLLPPLRGHLAALRAGPGPSASLRALLAKPLIRRSLLLSAVTMMSGFIIIPNFPAFLQYNLGYPGERLDLVYLLGGAVSFVTARIMGPLVDRYGSARVGTFASVLIAGTVMIIFVWAITEVPVLVLSSLFFHAMGSRMVAYSTLTSKVPDPHERARFQSVQSAVQHAASAVAAFVSAKLLSELPDHRLVHVERPAYLAIGLSLTVPVIMFGLERALRARPEASLRAG